MNKFLKVTNKISLFFLALLSILQYTSGEFYFLMNLILLSVMIITLMINEYNHTDDINIANSVDRYEEETEKLRLKGDNVQKLISSICNLCTDKLGFTTESIDNRLNKDFGINLGDIYENSTMIDELPFPDNMETQKSKNEQ
jgi:hypothetical protein